MDHAKAHEIQVTLNSTWNSFFRFIAFERDFVGGFNASVWFWVYWGGGERGDKRRALGVQFRFGFAFWCVFCLVLFWFGFVWGLVGWFAFVCFECMVFGFLTYISINQKKNPFITIHWSQWKNINSNLTLPGWRSELHGKAEASSIFNAFFSYWVEAK